MQQFSWKKGHVLLQDLQDEVKKEVKEIIKIHENMQNELRDCKKILI